MIVATRFAAVVVLLAASASLAESPPVFLGAWGGTGTVAGQFRGAAGIAIDASGRVYVADPGNKRIQSFDAIGNYVGEGDPTGIGHIPRDVTLMADGSLVSISSASPFLERYDPITNPSIFIGTAFSVSPAATASYGCAGNSAGFLFATGITAGSISGWNSGGFGSSVFPGGQPTGIAVAPGGDLYVVFAADNLVRHYTSALALLGGWGGPGSGPGQFNGPYAIAVDGAGDVYVADTGNDRVQKFTYAGGFLSAWGTHGTGPGQFDQPDGIEINSYGDVYVSDFTGNRVQRFGYPVVPTTHTSWGRVKALFR